MGDVRGFLKHDRAGTAYRPVAERLDDWKLVQQDFDADKSKVQASRCMDCGIPFCNNGCPLGNVIPDFNDLVFRDKWEDALARLHSTNNFPEFTGLVCPAPCEQACVLGINQKPGRDQADRVGDRAPRLGRGLDPRRCAPSAAPAARWQSSARARRGCPRRSS